MKPHSLALVTVLFAASLASAEERHITILGTNDIHGEVEKMPIWAGYVAAMREASANEHGEKGGVLLVDAGDQFQGTLLSNSTEGDVIFDAMNRVGYDAAVPGNHDYDFGPRDYEVDGKHIWADQVTPENTDQNPRGVIESLARRADFKLLSANTYFRDSIVDVAGNPVQVSNVGCNIQGTRVALPIDWSKAYGPEFLNRYLIKEVAGVRVAIIGIDNPHTPTTTTPQNVTDLCFREEFESYAEIRRELDGKADIFVLVIHDGNSSNDNGGTELLKQINALEVTSGSPVDVIVAGHTHFVNHVREDNVRLIQSGSGGDAFGRVDLVYDTESKKVLKDRTQSWAGLKINASECPQSLKTKCKVSKDGTLAIEGVEVHADETLTDLISESREELKPIAERKLGYAEKNLKRDRIAESPLADALTDAFRLATGAEIAFINTGGIRDDIPAGDVTYEQLFKVLPNSNRGWLIGPMNAKQLFSLLERSINTCGGYGALMQSGLRVSYVRDCAGGKVNAQLLRVETLDGTEIRADDERTFEVATLDFLAAGGSGYDGFKGIPLVKDFGIVRELIADALLVQPGKWSGQIDGRWKQVRQSKQEPDTVPKPVPLTFDASDVAEGEMVIPQDGKTVLYCEEGRRALRIYTAGAANSGRLSGFLVDAAAAKSTRMVCVRRGKTSQIACKAGQTEARVMRGFDRRTIVQVSEAAAPSYIIRCQ